MSAFGWGIAGRGEARKRRGSVAARLVQVLTVAATASLFAATSAHAQAETPPSTDDLPISLQPAMGPAQAGEAVGAAGTDEQPAGSGEQPATAESEPVPPPDGGVETGDTAEGGSTATGNDALLHMKPAMPAQAAPATPQRPETGRDTAEAAAEDGSREAGAARPAGTGASSAEPETAPAGHAGARPVDTTGRPFPADGERTREATSSGTTGLVDIPNVVPHFLMAGVLSGLLLAMLLVLLASGRRENMTERIGAGVFGLGALMFVLAYTGMLGVLPFLAAPTGVAVRLATLAEALLLFGAGWWLVAWLGTPRQRGWRIALMVAGGMMLSLVLLAPAYPASLLPVVRLALLLLAVGGLAALLWPSAAPKRHLLGHLVLAGLFAWSVAGLLLTLGLVALSSASAVLWMAAAATALALLMGLATLADGTRKHTETTGMLALQGADALPFRYEPHADKLTVPERLAQKLHFPPDVLETTDGFLTIVHQEDRPLLEAALRAASLDEPVEMPLRLADGEGVWRQFMLRARAVAEEPRAPRVISGLLLETTSGAGTIAVPDEETDSLAVLHDPLTGLPGQALLLDRLDSALTRARRGEGIPCLVILDVDRFRAIIDALGIGAGDLLIVALARRLQGLLNDGETVARLPGDQFALIIDAEQHGTPMSFVRRIREMLAEPFDLDGHEAVITLSAGVVDLVAAMMLSPREAIRAAEIALFEARRNGPGHEAFYTPDMHGEHARLAKLEQELRRALKAGELEVHYQPVVWLNGRLLAGFEALLRWRHPRRGLLGPEDFLGLAEEIGLMREIGQFVLREVVRQLGIWQRTFRTEYPFYISVNIAATDLLDPALAERVGELLTRENADPAGLKIEITEHLLMRDPALARATLTRLAEIGVGVFCDDFGTGHSSLARLRTLPFDALKIDRGFLSQNDAASRGIIGAVVDLAHGLSMRVVAEGVEEAWQLEMLEALGCDLAQGYLLAEAMDAASIMHAMTEARRIAPFAGRMAALSHILLNEEVAPPLPEGSMPMARRSTRRQGAAGSAGEGEQGEPSSEARDARKVVHLETRARGEAKGAHASESVSPDEGEQMEGANASDVREDGGQADDSAADISADAPSDKAASRP